MSTRQTCGEWPARRNLYEEAVRQPALDTTPCAAAAPFFHCLPAARPRRPESGTAPGGVWRAKGRWAWRAANYR